MPPGRYREWDQDLEVLPQGKVVVPGTAYLAGSWAFTDTCVRNAIQFGGVTLAEAIDMAGARPRELLGLPAVGLEAGKPADLIAFERNGDELRVRSTIVGGRLVSITA
jgi:N-acetylglucosamine-6-phosphate deacetylase